MEENVLMIEEHVLSFWDILGPVIYLPIILFISFYIKNKREVNNPIYRYYTRGLIAKFVGAIFFCLIYSLHYKGGDTVNYFISSVAMTNLMTYNFSNYIDLMTGGRYWHFNEITGIPAKYMFDDPKTFFVVILSNPFVFLGFKSFITSSILISWITYNGVWKFYLMFTDIYPKLAKQLSFTILLIPSTLFWGSGIAKDTYSYSSCLWLVYNFYMIFIKKQKIPINVIVLIINIYLILSIKPYIFVALFPLLIIWVIYQPLKKIRNNFLKTAIAPAILLIGTILGTVGLSLMSESLGEYSSYDKVVTKAQVTQQDHLREEAYGGNNYDIGHFDGTVGSMLKVAPLATITGLYRPFIFEANNFTMLLSGLENSLLLYLTLMIVFKAGIIKAFNRVISEPLLLLSVLFTILFSYGIGISAANFGALVRFKIPIIPFFASAIIVMMAKHREEKEIEEKKLKEAQAAKAAQRAKVPGFSNKRFKL